MLTGLFQATSGDAEMYGFSLKHDMREIRKLIGVCPQHDILFDKLTVKEHLELFGAIKGMSDSCTLDAEVASKIEDVGLEDKADTISEHLSGGMKRRLSLAIALMGNPKIIFLDEPTSGMDPQARRQVWELLERARGDKIIVLTTHFMDEADILGDRIAVMSHGRLQCVGSSLFLKSRFGLGYHLVLHADHVSSQVAQMDTAALDDLITRHVPNATRVVDTHAHNAVAGEAGGAHAAHTAKQQGAAVVASTAGTDAEYLLPSDSGESVQNVVGVVKLRYKLNPP